MRKGRDGENGKKMEKMEKMENNGENSGPIVSLPVDRLTVTDCNADRLCQLCILSYIKSQHIPQHITNNNYISRSL